MEKQDIESMLHEPAKLKWACRRGMLELDVLLSNFLENGYNTLNDNLKRSFIELLELPDPELFSLLMQQIAPKDESEAKLVANIRQYARGKHV